MDNAVKFIEKTGSIYMTIRKGSSSEKDNKGNGGDEVIIDIKDTGIGIHDEIFPRLFTKFATNLPLELALVYTFQKALLKRMAVR